MSVFAICYAPMRIVISSDGVLAVASRASLFSDNSKNPAKNSVAAVCNLCARTLLLLITTGRFLSLVSAR